MVYDCGAAIAKRVPALDWLLLHYAAIITLPVSKTGLCPKQGTLSYLLHLSTEM